MRNQIVRVLGACLLGASASAQASATSFQQAPGTQPSRGELASELLGSTGGSSLAEPNGTGTDDRSWMPLRERLRPDWMPQNGEDEQYTMRTLFLQHHGEFMNRRERYDPELELRVRALPNQRINGEPGSFDLLGYDFDVEAPMLITTEAYLLFGIYQYGRRYKTTSPFGSAGNAAPNPNFGDDTLTAAGVRVGFGWFLADNVLLEVETNPGVYSDLEDSLNHKDFDWPSSALVTVRTLENFFFKFGARYNQIYEDAPWLPYLGFSWEVAEGVRIDMLLPEMVEISWWPTASTSFSIGTMVQGAQYQVHSTLPPAGKQAGDVQIQEVITYFGLTHRFTDSFSLSARTGVVVAGDYELTTGATAFDPAEGALDQGFYADITMGIDW